jgi:soluble lytic murein transglycosylase
MLSQYKHTIRLWTDPVGRALFRLRLRPNHLTLMGFGVSLMAAAAFVAGQERLAGVLLIVAGLFDFFDGSLARASGQVTPFGAFLDSVIDRYSDLVVLLGIVVLFANRPRAHGALLAMAGLVGSMMVSYTKARAESIGIECRVGFMERPERMICLIAGALFNLLEPALWVLAILANLTALQRIAYTRRAMRESELLRTLLCGIGLLMAGLMGPTASDAVAATAAPPAAPTGAAPVVSPETERAWAAAVEALQQGNAAPVAREFTGETVAKSGIGDHLGLVLADALARRGDLGGARAAAFEVADRHRDSRLAPRALILASVLASESGDELAAQDALARLINAYPDRAELIQALYLLGQSAEARGQLDAAVAAYRQITLLGPTSGWADGAGDRLRVLASAGTRVPELSVDQRMDRAERLLRGGVPEQASEEARRVLEDSSDPGITVRALRVVGEAARRLKRYELAARTTEMAAKRAPQSALRGLQLEQARLLEQAGNREAALPILADVAAHGSEAEASEALYLRARVLDEMNRNAAAATAYRSVASRFPNREVAGAALWRLGWMFYLGGDVQTGEKTWHTLSELPGGRGLRVQALYWTGRAREQRSGTAAAAPLYRRVLAEAPRSYYGLLAAGRVSGAALPAPEPTIRLPDDPRDAIADDPGFARVALLRRIGLVESALQELDDVVARSVGDTVRLYGLTSAYVDDERYHLALRVGRRHFASLAVTGASLPPAFWQMLYPLGWREQLMEAAARHQLDPYLVAALVREESSYYPRAVSRAGARGLMQLMPATAKMVASSGAVSTYAGSEELDEPAVNLLLGTKFLADLMREFNDPRIALAAYNAGPRRAKEWWAKRRSDDVEVWVEQIPYDETRQYVKRVMLSWDEYRRIYGGR